MYYKQNKKEKEKTQQGIPQYFKINNKHCMQVITKNVN